MRHKLFINISVVAFILGVLSLPSATMWLTSNNAISNNLDFKNQKEGYQLEIDHLKQTLERTEMLVNNERRFAARLQRELRDAYGQIDELSRKLTEADKSKAQIKQQRKTVSVIKLDRQAVSAPQDKSGKINSGKASKLSSAVKHEYVKAKVSAYAPSSEVVIRAKRAPGQSKNNTHLVASSALPDVGQKQLLKVAAVTSQIGKKIREKSATKASKTKAPELPSIASINNREPQPNANLLSKDAERQNINPQTEEPLQMHRTARFEPDARLGKPQRPVNSAKKSSDKGQSSLFNRLARQGVFGSGYSVE